MYRFKSKLDTGVTFGQIAFLISLEHTHDGAQLGQRVPGASNSLPRKLFGAVSAVESESTAKLENISFAAILDGK
jgi:hypothetical protein